MSEHHSTQEYSVAPYQSQKWADDEHHKHMFVTPVEAAKSVGVDLSNEKVKVKCNDGQERDIDVDFKFFTVSPAAKYAKVYVSLDPKSPRQNYFMVKGGSPKGKTSVWFTQKDFDASPDFKALKEKVTAAIKKYRELHGERIKKQLAKSHSAIAKKAIKELPAIAKESGAKGVYEWFKNNKFNVHADTSDFEGLVGQIKHDGRVVSRWDVHSKPDGHGHVEGRAIQVDWENKVVKPFGWSST